MYVLNKLGGRRIIKLRAILLFKIIIYACLLTCPVQQEKKKKKHIDFKFIIQVCVGILV